MEKLLGTVAVFYTIYCVSLKIKSTSIAKNKYVLLIGEQTLWRVGPLVDSLV